MFECLSSCLWHSRHMNALMMMFNEQARSIGTRLTLVFCCLMAMPSLGCGQTGVTLLRVELATADGHPVTGALIALLDMNDRVLSEGLSADDGSGVLRALAGQYRIRVRRIGFRPFTSDVVTMPREKAIAIQVESPRVVLSTIVITAKATCGGVGLAADTIATVWEEAEKALQLSRLTLSDIANVSQSRIFSKRTDSDGAVVALDSARVLLVNHKPFGSPNPELLASRGYVFGNDLQGWEYFGPDESVLLSDEFRGTHCFRLVRDAKRPSEIGLGFEPLPRRTQSDIGGVLWVNDSSSTLTEVVFQYRNAGLLSDFTSGGYTRFSRLPSGATVVSDWLLTAPILQLVPGGRQRIVVVGRAEDGGTILNAKKESTRIATGISRLEGFVYDSLSSRGLRSALVFLGDRFTRTDDRGGFAFDSVPEGTSRLSFTHPRLSDLGATAIESVVVVKGNAVSALLATPSPQKTWERLCGLSSSMRLRDATGILHGYARDTDGGAIENGTIQLTWNTPGTSAVRQEIHTDREGHFVSCGFSRLARGTLRLSAERELATRARDFSFESGEIVRRDLSYRYSANTTTAGSRRLLDLQVVDSVGECPISDAAISVAGNGSVFRTDDRGLVVIDFESPQVTFVARRTGFRDKTFAVSLNDSPEQHLTISMTPLDAPSEVIVRSSLTRK